MVNSLLIGAPLFLMAVIIILLLKNWQKSIPIFKKIGNAISYIWSLAIFFGIIYLVYSFGWPPFKIFVQENITVILKIILYPLNLTLLITSFYGLYFLSNRYAQPSNKIDDDKMRSAAVGWATFLGGTLNYFLVYLFLTFGPFASSFAALEFYSRALGLEGLLSSSLLLALSCWSIIPFVYERSSDPRA